MRKLVIYVDADEVLNDLDTQWLRIANERFGADVKLEDVTRWDIGSFFPEEHRAAFYAILQEPELYLSLEAKPGAAMYLNKLREDGHTIRVATSSEVRPYWAKVQRMRELFPFLQESDFILISDKSLLQGDVLIDDCVDNLIDAPFLRLLFDRPYNRGIPEGKLCIYRMLSWQEIYDFVTRFANQSDEESVAEYYQFGRWYVEKTGFWRLVSVFVLLCLLGCAVGLYCFWSQFFHVPHNGDLVLDLKAAVCFAGCYFGGWFHG